MSSPSALVPLSLTIALAVRKRGVAAWLPIALSPAAAMTAGGLFTRLLPQQFAPDDSGERSFPSGHATGMTAEVLTTAYVLSREKVIPTGLAFSLCGLPLVAGVNRVYRGRHWASDVLAGWAAGTTLAAACAIAYERLRSSSGCGNRPHTR